MNNTCWFVSLFNNQILSNHQFFLKINFYLITYNKLIISLQRYL